MGLKDELEGVERVMEAHERFGAWCAALGSLGFGIFIGWFPPEELAKEIPPHRLVGAGFAGFGLVFLIALAGRGGAARRAKNLLLAVGLGLFAAGGAYIAWTETNIVLELEAKGVEKTLPVYSITPNFADGKGWKVELREGRMSYRLDLDSSVQRGQTMTFLVHPENRRWTAVTPAGSSHLEIVDARGKRWHVLVGAGVALLLGLWSLVLLWNALIGAPSPDE